MNLMQNLTNFAPLIVIVIIILIAVARAKKTNSTSLVLTKFYVNKDGPNNIFVSNCVLRMLLKQNFVKNAGKNWHDF
ncbi:MAG: hypothetical protein EVJ48_09155 [Candidatus Acidulodesulfobacterium acidiphilum]|uniref:Uncharacterized protein n=1 Tax=Candidatus Acidulodesulfobacterium acidiphilum TaxID=2597224 RepID=A0A520X7Y6_9DELT|nr:MAG: hypothetical protein EVJ48_09155 [Candidatus Acidulodesulfobacterium acidiphilum]